MIYSTRPYSANLRKLRRRLRDSLWYRPRIAGLRWTTCGATVTEYDRERGTMTIEKVPRAN